MHFPNAPKFIYVNHLDVDDNDGDVDWGMHAGESADGWLHFHLSYHNIWISNAQRRKATTFGLGIASNLSRENVPRLRNEEVACLGMQASEAAE